MHVKEIIIHITKSPDVYCCFHQDAYMGAKINMIISKKNETANPRDRCKCAVNVCYATPEVITDFSVINVYSFHLSLTLYAQLIMDV